MKAPKGIRRTAQGTWQVFARRDGTFRSKTFPADTSIDTLRREREKLIGRLLHPELDAPTTRPTAHPFDQDAETYLALVTGMPSAQDRAYHIREWAKAFGARDRTAITARDIRRVLEQWRLSGHVDGEHGLAAGSLNRRRTALQSMYTTLDGKSAANPVRDVPKYDESDSEEIRAVDPALLYRLIARVGRRKWRHRRKAHRGTPHPISKTRARLRLMLWTGWPQAQIMRLSPGDIDWKEGSVWIGRRRKGKGGKGRRLPLLPGAVAALKMFVAAKAWGPFSTSAMHSALARAVAQENAWRARIGRPPIDAVHPYQLRHTFGTELAKRITDERVLQEMMLHSTPMQTRRYTEAATAPRLLEARQALVGAKVAEKLLAPSNPRKRSRKTRKRTAF